MADALLTPGTMVGAYRVDRHLGGGGVGTVYAAEEPTIRKRVAIKVLRNAFADDAAMMTRFEREAQAANDIHHPGIVDVLGFGKLPDGRPYLVMSLLEGRSLREEIASRGRIPPRDAWAIAREVAEALAAAHEAGVVHRDLKPDNVFLERWASSENRPPRPRVLDFGLAKMEATDEANAQPMHLTKSGVPLGTPAYMAPEQWWSQGVEARTDQYGFGAMLFEMLTGAPPFSSQQFAMLVQQHLHEKPPTLAASGVEVAPEIEALVARTLAKATTDRFADMRALIAEGDRAFADASGESASDRAFVATGAVADSAEVVSAPTELAGPSLAIAPTEVASAAELASPAIPRPRLARFRFLLLVSIALGLGALRVIGYAGDYRYDFREIWKMAGWGAPMTTVLFVVAVIVTARTATRRAATGASSLAPLWLAVVVAGAGALGAYTGWIAIIQHLSRSPETGRFGFFSQGLYEANGCRFIGYELGAILCLAIVALAGIAAPASATTTLSDSIGLRGREKQAASLGLVAVAVVAVLAGAPSAALIAGTAAAALGIGALMPPRDARNAVACELEQSFAGLLAALFATGAGFARLEARESVLWNGELLRAARAEEILAAAGERKATVAIAVASIAAICAIEGLRIRRLVERSGVPRPRSGVIFFAVFFVAATVTELCFHTWFMAARDEIRIALAPQFSLFGRLDPPSGDALDVEHHRPQKAPALQIARDVIALNGEAKAKLAALDSPTIAQDLARDIGKLVAEAAKNPDSGAPDLAVSIDREVPWARVEQLLAMAYSVGGVRKIELLFTRGPTPVLAASGPPEAGYVLASDFVALEAELAATGLTEAPEKRFGDIAPDLIARGADGHLVLRATP